MPIWVVHPAGCPVRRLPLCRRPGRPSGSCRCAAALASHRGKAREEFCLLPHFGEDLCLGVAGDVVGDGKGAIGAGTFGVHPALGDHLPVEVGEFLLEPDILQERRSAWSGGHGVLIVDDGCAGPGGKFFLLFFDKILLLM